MFHFSSLSSDVDLSATRGLRAWRTRVLEGILRGIFVIWLFALVSGINNVLEAYRLEAATTPNAKTTAVAVIVFYVGVTLLLSFITFVRKIPFNLRAGMLLFLFYIVGTIGLLLASLSGDGRIFLFALVIVAAVLFDLRASLITLGGCFLTLVGIGWLQVGGFIVVPPERQVNSVDAGAWISGTIVFVCLSVAGLISITYLLRVLDRSLRESRESLEREQRLGRVLRTISDINQMIVRERDQARLLKSICEILVGGRGYSFAWIGMLERDGLTLKLAASAGAEVDPAQFTLRLDREGSGPICAATALRTREPYFVKPSLEGDPCSTCPRFLQYPTRSAVALPLARDERDLGVLVVDHTTTGSVIDEEEIGLLCELADDVAYALDNIEADAQRHLLADTASALLTARDPESLWRAVAATVQQVMRSDRSAIYDYDRAHDRLSCPHASGLSKEYISELNRRFHEVPGSRVLATPQPVVINDVLTDPSVASMRDWMVREGFRSYAVFPLLAAHGSYGAFVAYRNAPVPFSDAEITAGQTLAHIVSAALENVRLHTETRAKAAELGRLYIALQEMSASLLDPPALLHALARHMAEALNVTSSYIASANQAEGTLVVLAEYWAEDASEAERKPDLGTIFQIRDYPTIMRAMFAGEVITLQGDDPRLAEMERRQFSDYGIQSMLFIPIFAHGKLLGDVEIWESRRRREFTQAEIRLAQTMAAQASSVIENAQLVEAERAQLRLSRTLQQVGELLTTELRLSEVLERLFDLLAHVVAYDSVSVQLFHADGALEMASGRGFPDLERARQVVREIGDQSIKQRHWTLGQALVIPDTYNDDRWLRLPGVEYIHSWIGAPLAVKGKIIGALNVDSRTVNAYNEAAAVTVMAFANQAAVAIENARLFEALQQREAYFRALIENSAEGVAILDVEGDFVYVAPSERPLTGYRPEEVLGRSAFENIHPEDRPRLMEMFHENAKKPGVAVTTEYRHHRKDGEWRYFEVTGHNMLDEPHVRGVVVNFRDITKRKQAEEDLRRRAGELESLVAVSSSLRAAPAVADMIPVVIREAAKVVGAANGAIFLIEEGSGDLISKGWYSAETDSFVRLDGERLVRHTIHEGVTGFVVRTGEIYATDHMQDDPLPLFVPGEAERLQGMNSGISLPLRAHNRIVGVLHVALREKRSFTETEVRLLTAIAEMAGSALQRATLFEQTLRHADELTSAYNHTLAGWARALELRDELTEGHTRRVTDLTLRLARAMGVAEPDLIHIQRGAILHDIGKMAIPDSILLKRGALTRKEQATMRQHPQFAFDMLYPIEFLRPALDIPLCHHEKWGGNGYPRGLKQEEIPLAARIFAVADVWDAITSDRPYRPAWAKEKAHKYIIAQSGKYFDPQVVKAFLSLNLE